MSHLLRSSRTVIQLLFFLSLLHLTHCQDDKKDVTPPFPQMFSSIVGQRKIHITSEIVSEDNGYQTLEEYLDLEIAKQTLVSTRRDSHSILLIDAFDGLSYNYQPYKCAVSKMADTSVAGLDGWSTSIRVADRSSKDYDMKLFGVSALWTAAANLPKVYSYGQVTYGAAQDAYRSTNTWTFEDKEAQVQVLLNFIDLGSAKSNTPSSMISSIQIKSLDGAKLIRTINILSAEYMIDDDVYDNLLQVPVGYNCVPPKDSIADGNKDQDRETWISDGSRKLDLEVTATKYGSDDSQKAGNKRSSSTLSVEIAYGQNGNDKNYLQLIRNRDSSHDTKTVVNHMYNTKYMIDLRRGTCEMNHISAKEARGAAPLTLKFANGLSLPLDLDTMFEIFINNEPFTLIKSVSNMKNAMLHEYMESSTMHLFRDQETMVRIVRTFVGTHLSSVTIWVLDDSQTQIMESYHINIVDMRLLDSIMDIPKVFDVSEECYFNNPLMVPGKDYVWMEFTYNVLSRFMDNIADRVNEIKRWAYTAWTEDYFRIPRIEVILNDSGFVVRMLVLDVPPVDKIYDQQFAKISDSREVDFESMSPDTSHCSDMCRLHACKTMTFCPNSHSCLVSSKHAASMKIEPEPSCLTYSLPEDRVQLEKLFDNTLHSLLGEYHRLDLSTVVVPKMPDELTYPRSESGLDEREYTQLANRYLHDSVDFLKQKQQDIAMVILMNIHGHYVLMIPSKFAAEADPLDDFNLRDDLELAGRNRDGMPMFHEGLGAARYKFNSFTDEQRRTSRLFSGLDYDQCSLACVDGRCGSFSFCNHRQECIITAINSTAAAKRDNLIETDVDCFISQRDFIGNFNKFPDAYRPASYEATADSHSASECAYNCMTATKFRCLGFTYCDTNGEQRDSGGCFYMKDRYMPPLDREPADGASPRANSSTGCDHYARSYLADFSRIESREILPEVLGQLKTSAVEGRSVFECAESCVNELADCTAFQFCFEPDSEAAMQRCTMVQSKLAAGAELAVEQDAQGEVVRAGKDLRKSANCHLFALRPDTSEAHLRDLALGVTLAGHTDAPSRKPGGGLTIGGGLVLYLVVTLVFTVVGAGVYVAREKSDFVRAKVERARLYLGV